MLITKAGKPVAAIVDLDLFERLQKLDDEFDELVRQLTRAFVDMDRDQGQALIDEAVAEARKTRR